MPRSNRRFGVKSCEPCIAQRGRFTSLDDGEKTSGAFVDFARAVCMPIAEVPSGNMPRREWSWLIPTLLGNMTADTPRNSARQVTLETLGRLQRTGRLSELSARSRVCEFDLDSRGAWDSKERDMTISDQQPRVPLNDALAPHSKMLALRETARMLSQSNFL